MRTRQIATGILGICLTLLTACQQPFTATLPAARVLASAPAAPARQASFDELPIYFIQNRGQTDPHVAYYVPGHSNTIYFSSDGLTIALAAEQAPTLNSPDVKQGLALMDPEMQPAIAPPSQRWAVKLDFVDANPKVQPVGQAKAKAVFSYFKGGPQQWQAGVPSYTQLRYSDLWPGIDLVYTGQAHTLKYEFVVQPGADPAQIQLAYRGASDVRLTANGQLEVLTPAGSFRDAAPLAYQLRSGQRVPVALSYALASNSGPNGRYAYGFRVGPYDPTLPLVLDPAVVVYSGYIGGAGDDHGQSIAVDHLGNAYITGWTTSSATTFPVAAGPDLSYSGGQDAFVAKVDASGSGLVYAGYIGGSAADFGYGIAVDGAGDAYVTGLTYSDQATFPVVVGPDLTFNGAGDGFVVKVNADGTALLYAGYIGGAQFDAGTGIAVDSAGNAYLTSATFSDQTTFPVVTGPDLTFNGVEDGYIAKVNAAGTGLVYSGYIGGAAADKGYAVAVDSSGNAYVTGWTLSDQATFPVLGGPDLTYNGGTIYGDAFVAKVNPEGTALLYAGYIGGTGEEVGNGIAVDEAGNAFVVGDTTSDQTSFPVTVGPSLIYNGGNADAFVAKVSPSGTTLVYAGYIGGANGDQGQGIALDGAGNAYIVGSTQSDQTTFPQVGGPDPTYSGNEDAYIAEVNATGSALEFAGYIGGAAQDQGFGIALDAAGNAYVTGDTLSNQASFPVLTGPDVTYNGGLDAFVAKVSTAHTWTGAIDDEWNKAGNWSPSGVPTGGDGLNCLIPAGLINYPTVSATTIGCDGILTIAAGAQFTTDAVNYSPGQVINVDGAWQASHTFDFHGTNSAVNVDSGGQLLLNAASIGDVSVISTTQNAINVTGTVQISGSVQVYHGTNLVINPPGLVSLALGAALALPGSGILTNTGTLEQVQVVTGPTEFLNVTDGASVDKYLGVVITPTAGSLLTTTVSIQGQQPCTSQTVARCYTIEPANENPATIEFYYSLNEANGNTAPNTYHWNGLSWDALSSTRGGSGIGQFVVATGVASYSPFALKDTLPTGVPFVHLYLPLIMR